MPHPSFLAPNADLLPPSHRLSERNARRYEHFIAGMLARLPQPTYYKPGHIATSTFMLGYRDAMSAFLANRHWPTAFNIDTLAKERPDISVTIDKDLVRVGYQADNNVPLDASTVTPNLSGYIDATQPGVMNAICCLFHYGYIRHPLDVHKLTDELIAELQNEWPNVAFFRQNADLVRVA